jgi:hypothetical protein
MNRDLALRALGGVLLLVTAGLCWFGFLGARFLLRESGQTWLVWPAGTLLIGSIAGLCWCGWALWKIGRLPLRKIFIVAAGSALLASPGVVVLVSVTMAFAKHPP